MGDRARSQTQVGLAPCLAPSPPGTWVHPAPEDLACRRLLGGPLYLAPLKGSPSLDPKECDWTNYSSFPSLYPQVVPALSRQNIQNSRSREKILNCKMRERESIHLTKRLLVLMGFP